MGRQHALRSWILRLHRSAGNRAVRSLLHQVVGRRKNKAGKAWNAGERTAGKIRRPPLHGYTEGTFRPYAGWRQLTDPSPSVAGMGKELEERLPRRRQGIDNDDTAPVRDVALDQVAQQLEDSGQTQLVIVLPQGGLRSEFAKDGSQSFNAKRYVAEIVKRLKTEGVWGEEPHVTRVTMAATAAPARRCRAWRTRGRSRCAARSRGSRAWRARARSSTRSARCTRRAP